MRIKDRLDYFLIVGIQALLSLCGFWVFWKQPKGVVFCDYGDGLKNLYNLIAYVKEPFSQDGFLKFNSAAYPFGEYVYYTDNTPLFAIPLRFFCHYVWDCSAYTSVLFQVFIISNIAVCGLLVYKVFRSLFSDRLFALIMAIVLPWVNMSIMRIVRGHANLSMTSLILIAIYLVILWDKYKLQRNRQLWVGVAMCVFTFLAFLVHGYFLAIIMIFLASVLLVHGVYHRKSAAGKFTIAWSGMYVIGSTGLTLLVLKLTDKFLLLRKANAMGYDSMDQKVTFSSLFTHYQFNKIYFPFSSPYVTNDAEKAGYLGNIGLCTLLLMVVVALCHPASRRKLVAIQKQFFSEPLVASIFLGSLVLLSISFGETYTIDRAQGALKITNLTNPFFYLHFITKRIEQFRSLERFIYPFFFGFYVYITFVLVKFYQLSGKLARAVLIGFVVFLGGVEVRDHVNRMRGGTDLENPLDEHNLSLVKLPHIDYSRYQAILPIPYYCAGSEDYNYTIDGADLWVRYNFQLGLISGLPSMGYVLSRVPPEHNIALANLVADNIMDASLKKRFNAKPVLVAVNRKLLADSASGGVPVNTTAKGIYWKISRFIETHAVTPIDSAGYVVFYSWYPLN